MKMTYREIQDLIRSHGLLKDTTWRHIKTQTVYQIVSLAYDSDREVVVVQYRSHDENYIVSPLFSHTVDRFKESFEQVELVKVWEKTRG